MNQPNWQELHKVSESSDGSVLYQVEAFEAVCKKAGTLIEDHTTFLLIKPDVEIKDKVKKEQYLLFFSCYSVFQY